MVCVLLTCTIYLHSVNPSILTGIVGGGGQREGWLRNFQINLGGPLVGGMKNNWGDVCNYL